MMCSARLCLKFDAKDKKRLLLRTSVRVEKKEAALKDI